MASKLIHEIPDDQKLEKHIGCMKKIFRIFDRKPAIRSRNQCPQKQLHGPRIAVDNSSRWDSGLVRTECLDSESPRHSFESFLHPKTSARSAVSKASPFDGSEPSYCFNSRDPPRPSFDSKEAAQILSFYRNGSKGASVVPEGNAKCFLEAVEAKKSKTTSKIQVSPFLEARLTRQSSVNSDTGSTSSYARKSGNRIDGKNEKGHSKMFANIKKAGANLKPIELHRKFVDVRETPKLLTEEDYLILQNLKACETVTEAFPSSQPLRKSADTKESLRILSKPREAVCDNLMKEASKTLVELVEPPRHSCDGWEALKLATDRIPKQLKEPPRHSVDGSLPLHGFRYSRLLPNTRNHCPPNDLTMRSLSVEVGSSSILAQKNSSVKPSTITASQNDSHIQTRGRKPNIIARLMGLDDMPIARIDPPNSVLDKFSREAKVNKDLLLHQPSKDPIQTKMIVQRGSSLKKPVFEATKDRSLATLQVESRRTVDKAGISLDGGKWQDRLHDNDHHIVNASSIDTETVTKAQVSTNLVQKTNSLILTKTDLPDWLDESKPKSISGSNITYDYQMEACSKNGCIRKWKETTKASFCKESGADLNTSKDILLETMWKKESKDYYNTKRVERMKQKDYATHGSDTYGGAANTELMKTHNHVAFPPRRSKRIKGQDYMLCSSDKLSNVRRLSKAQQPAEDQRYKRPVNQLKGEKPQVTEKASISNSLQHADSISRVSEIKPIKASSSTQSSEKSCSTVMTALGSSGGGCSKTEDKAVQKMKEKNPSGKLCRDKGESIATMAMQSHMSRASQRRMGGTIISFRNSSLTSSPNSDAMGDPEPVSQVHQPLQGNVDQLRGSNILVHSAQSYPPINGGSIKDSECNRLEEMMNIKSDNLSEGVRYVFKLDKSTHMTTAILGDCMQEPYRIPHVQEHGKKNAQSNQIMPICEGLQNVTRTCNNAAEERLLKNHNLPAISIGPKTIEINKFSELRAISKYGRALAYEPLLIQSKNQEQILVGTVLESSEQPSPVSVLDNLFHDENSPKNIVRSIILPDSISRKSLETSYQAQTVGAAVLRADLDASESLTFGMHKSQDTSSNIYSYNAEINEQRSTFKDNSKESLEALLLTSDFLEVGSILFWWQYLDFPTIGNVIEGLANGGRLSSNKSPNILDPYTNDLSNTTTLSNKKSIQINHQLHVTFLLEVLVKNLFSYVDACFYLLKPPRGFQILEDAWDEVCNTRCLCREGETGSMLSILEKDLTAVMDQWHLFHVEIAEMSSIVERMILEDILYEFIDDWAPIA